MRRLFAAVTAAALAIAPAAARADDYSEQVYTSSAPNGPDWLALASPQGTWAIQVGEGCPWVASGLGMNVLLSAPVDTDGAILAVPDTAEFGAGESCPITAQVWQSGTPCVVHEGVCDVAYD